MGSRLEKKSPPAEKSTGHPQCIGGVGAAPPEDCGGSKAFEQFHSLFTPAYIVHRLAEMLDNGLTAVSIPISCESPNSGWFYSYMMRILAAVGADVGGFGANGKLAAAKFNPILGSVHAEFPLELVQVDHTLAE